MQVNKELLLHSAPYSKVHVCLCQYRIRPCVLISTKKKTSNMQETGQKTISKSELLFTLTDCWWFCQANNLIKTLRHLPLTYLL